MAKKWCANFELDHVLQNGLSNAMWMFQYQYAHDGFDYQENPAQKHMIRNNLKTVARINSEDWLLAYLAASATTNQTSTFYAVGQVIEPRLRFSSTVSEDTIERTLLENKHRHLNGIIRYKDAPAFYEDLSDDWSCPADQSRGDQPKVFLYPQRYGCR